MVTFAGDPPPYVPPPPPPSPPPDDDVDFDTAYYVSASGDDGDDGSELNPFATIQHVLDLPPDPGTGIIIKGGAPLSGTGNRNIVITDGLSGSAGAPITIMSALGEEARIDLGANGLSSTDNYFLIGATLPMSHWAIRGIEFLNGCKIQNGLITISATSGLADDWLIYGCIFHKVPPGDNSSNGGAYFGSRCGERLIEQCRFIGPGWTGDSNADANGVQTDHPMQDGGLLTIRYNVFIDCVKGIQIYGDDSDARVVIEHNTFIDCGRNIELTHYATANVRDNAGTSAIEGSSQNLYDSGEGSAVKDHNFWGQTFDVDYSLLPGNTGINAASDGTDAGAINS